MQHNIHWNQRTKIVCTLGPGVSRPSTIEQLIRAGMNIARINRSHSTMEEHAEYIRMVRKIAKRLGSNVAILMDLPGPKYRTGEMKDKSAELKKGARVTLTNRPVPGDQDIIPINFPSLYLDVKIGTTILVDDGAIQLRVEEIRGQDVVCKVIVGGVITKGRGVVVPGVRVSEPFLTSILRENIDFAARQQPDYIALSFVNTAEDVEQVREILRQKKSDIPIISKIERAEALKNFDSILAVSDGIMVARGDLGVEIPLKKVPIVQKNIIRKCNIAGKTVITATQMLESMITSARPTRAEISDVANAILDGTDAVMLSAETSIGKYPVQAVKMMDSIARETELHLPYEQMVAQKGQWVVNETDELISYNACYTAMALKAAAIVAYTHTGSTARRVSKYRPKAPIIAITPVKETMGRLMFYWGVQSFYMDTPPGMEDMFSIGVKVVKDLKIAKPGDLIVITGGLPAGTPGSTNMLKVQRVT